MDQLTGVDAGFLALETPRAPAHVGLLTVFAPTADGKPLSLDSVRAVIDARLHLMPPLRRRLAEVPLGIDRPYWFEDPDFDLDFHVRQAGLPRPGTDEQLADLVARIHSRPLDRTRPLWELYVISGLADGRTAQYTKIHQAAVDAVTGADLMTVLLDTDPVPGPVEDAAVPWSPDRRPNPGEMFARGLLTLASRPGRALRMATPLARQLTSSSRRQLPQLLSTARDVLERVPGVRDVPGLSRLEALAETSRTFGRATPLTAPRTSFNQRITQHRRVATCSVDFDDVHRVRDAFGVNVNDVVLTLCAGAVRAWLADRRELPTDPLVALVPLSVVDESAPRHSRVSAMVVVLPTDEADAVRRLGMMATATADAQRDHDAVPASLLADVSHFASPSVASLAARVVGATRVADVANPPFNLAITNVPGPQQPLYCAGARQVATWSLPGVVDGVGLHLTAMSYDGRVHFAAVSCRELMPDLWGLVRTIPATLAELVEAAGATESDRTRGARHDRTA